MIKYLTRNLFTIGDMVFSSIINANSYRNMVQIVVLEISRKFQLSKKTVENVQRGWNRGFIRCLRKRTDGSRRKLILRASSHDNRLISFSNFLNHPSTLFDFFAKCKQPDFLAKESI